MEISNNKKKLTVTKSELESKISSKKDLHYILRQCCKKLLISSIGQYYIPNMNQCSIAYLKDVLCEMKIVLIVINLQNRFSNYKISKITSSSIWRTYSRQNVYQSKGIHWKLGWLFSRLWAWLCSPKKYFWDIFSTLNQELAEKFIDHAIKERNKQKVIQESKIDISAEIMDQISKKHFYSRQKGRALSMLVSSIEIYKVNRKRKR